MRNKTLLKNRSNGRIFLFGIRLAPPMALVGMLLFVLGCEDQLKSKDKTHKLGPRLSVPATSAEKGQEKRQMLKTLQAISLKERLLGADSSEIKDLYGPPDFIRWDDTVQYWRYKSDICHLAVFLYPGLPSSQPEESEKLYAKYYEIFNPTHKRVSEEQCLRTLAEN